MSFRWLVRTFKKFACDNTPVYVTSSKRCFKRSRPHHSRLLQHEPLETRALLAAVPILDNLSKTPVEVEWVDQIAVGNTAFYSTRSTVNGQYELWRSDGTSETTGVIKSFSKLEGMKTRVGADVYFVAADDAYGQQLELWKSNGTTAGTHKLKAGSLARISGLANVADSLYFIAMDVSDFTYGLWKSDGTDQQTTLIKSLPTPSFAQHSVELVVAGDQIFFLLDEGSGTNLWTSRGTSDTTKAVKPFDDGGPIHVTSLNAIQNQVIFSGYSVSLQQYVLWQSDGTATNTAPVRMEDGTIYSLGYYPGQIKSIAKANELFFTNVDYGQPSPISIYSSETRTARVLYDSDGQPIQNATMASDTLLGGFAYFVANASNGRTLWKSDGTATGTTVVDSRGTFLNPSQLTVVGKEIYFRAFATLGSSGEELWKTDGTALGTKLVRDIVPGFESSNPSHLMAAGTRLAFFATTPTTGTQPWSVDTATQATRLVRRLDSRDQGTQFYGFVSLGSFGLIGAKISQTGYTLLRTDGTNEGTVPLMTFDHAPKNFYRFNDKAVFTINQRLWITDGAAAGTKPLLAAGPLLSESPNFIQLGGVLYFVAKHESGPDLGFELWRTDGTLRGTRMVRDIAPGALNSAPGYDGNHPQMVVNNGLLFFTAYDSMLRRQLYRSNGTAAGTLPVKVDGPIEVSNLLAANGRVYFSGTVANDFTRRLYSTDGKEIKEIKAASPQAISLDNRPSNTLATLSSSTAIYFVASAGMSVGGASQLWKTNGTTGSTIPALSLGANTPVDITDLSVQNDRLWFFATNPKTNQRSLYVSDGTAKGTVALRSFEQPDLFAANRPQFTTLNGFVYFSAYTTKQGTELWQSDGTAKGTVLTADLNRGLDSNQLPKSSNPNLMGSQGNYLIFNADNGRNVSGSPWSNESINELYLLPTATAPLSRLQAPSLTQTSADAPQAAAASSLDALHALNSDASMRIAATTKGSNNRERVTTSNHGRRADQLLAKGLVQPSPGHRRDDAAGSGIHDQLAWQTAMFNRVHG